MTGVLVCMTAVIIQTSVHVSRGFAFEPFRSGSLHLTVKAPQAVRPVFDVSPYIEEVSAALYDPDEGLVWTLGDSGTGPFVGKTCIESGITSRIAVQGAENIDWEALVRDEEGCLWICDVGDNRAAREYVCLYKINPEEITEKNTVGVDAFLSAVYPDGPMDVEAAVYDNGSIYFIEKLSLRTPHCEYPRVVSVPLTAPCTFVQTARREGCIALDRFITDAAVTPEGVPVMLTYSGMYRCMNWSGKLRLGLSLKHFFFGQQESIAAIGKNRFLVGVESGAFFLISLRGHFLFSEEEQ